MFLCGNMCTGGDMEPELNVKEMPFQAKVLSAITNARNDRSKKPSHIMVKKSKFQQHVDQHILNKTKFVDKDFPSNDKSLQFRIAGREIVWERITDIVPNCVMVEDDFSPNDIQQGNIGDCYFLSSIAALALDEDRIESIFHDNFKINELGIYNIVVVQSGVPTEMVIDDYIPVFADTKRPVFCKATGRQIWVVLLEKAWAKIKGSYGAISAGCPHEVLQTFSVAPCYYYQLENNTEQSYLDEVWDDLTDAADEMMPVVAGTKETVVVNGLQPNHAYTVLDSSDVTSNGKTFRIMRLRNPWGKTEYSGFASQNDKQFWNGVEKTVKDRMRPSAGVNDGDFCMPFEEFMKDFNSIDISNVVFGFSYQFQKVKMYREQPLFIRFDVKEEHEAFITVERNYGKGDTNQQTVTTNYGYSRMVIAQQRDSDKFEYYDSWLETDFPDITRFVKFKPGRYVMYVEVDDPRLSEKFEATFSYYYDSMESREGKNITVEYNQKYPSFLESVFMTHALRINKEKSKIGPCPEDWVKTHFMYQEGGYGYVMCNLQRDTNIRVAANINEKKIKENGFEMMSHHSREHIIGPGQFAIFVFSCNLDSHQTENYSFPPAGFRISRIA